MSKVEPVTKVEIIFVFIDLCMYNQMSAYRSLHFEQGPVLVSPLRLIAFSKGIFRILVLSAAVGIKVNIPSVIKLKVGL